MNSAIDLHAVRTTTVVFHGRLKSFGSVTARASTPARLVAAAIRLRPGLQAAMLEGQYNCYRGEVRSGNEMELVGLHLTLPDNGTLHVIPAGSGAKSGGIGKAILGAVIIAGAVGGAFFTGGASLGALGASTGFLGVTYGSVALFGASLFVSGISQLISPQSTSSVSASDSSTTISGVSNSVDQGSCVPLIYGKQVRVGSTTISAGYSAEDYNSTVTPFSNPADDGSNAASVGTGSGASAKSSGSSSGGAKEAANTLRSKAVVRIIDVLGEGPGVNLIAGAKSVYFNGTPLMASDGTFNFKGVSYLTRSGDPDQAPVTGYPSAEETHSLTTQVKANSPVTATMTSETATAARVTIRIPALFTTDTSNGNINVGPDLGIKVEVRPLGGSFATVVNDLLHGQKCTSEYQKSYRFDLPGINGANTPGSWDIRVSRTTPDSTVTTTSSDLYFDYYDAITDHLLIYPNTAYVAFTIDSSAFGNSVPTRTYDVMGKAVQVPTNYDTVQHTYATSGPGTSQGTWDGVSWKVGEAVDDPCWIALDMVQSDRYGFGLGANVTAGLAYDLYPISQYCAQAVDDGLFGTEPRYTVNVCITSAGDAYQVIQQFAGAFRGMSYWTAGGVAFSADMPTAPVMLVTNANVIGGKFTYEGSAGSTRHNIARVSYINSTNNYQSDIEVYVDQYSVSSVGARSVDVDAFGCTSRGLARRLGHWMIDSELHQTQTVTYDCGIDHAGIRPGDIIAIADQHYQGARLGGRCRGGINPHLVAIDQNFTPDPTQTYTIQITNSDGSIYNSPVTAWNNQSDSFGPYCILTISNVIGTVVPNAIFIITATPTYNTPEWQVISNLEKSSGLYSITALFFDPGKFNRVELNQPFNPQSFSNLPMLLATPIPPPTNVSALDYTVGVGTTTVIRVNVGWTPATDSRITGYSVRSIDQNTGETIVYNAGDTTSYNVDGLPLGTYTFSVEANGKNGQSSVWVDAANVNVDGSPDAPPAPTAMTAVGGTRRISLSWVAPVLRNLLHYELQRAPDNNGSPGSFSTLTYVDATSYTDTDEDNLEPLTTWWYMVRAISTLGTLGVFSNQVSAETTELLVDDLPTAIQNTAKYAQGLLTSIGTPIDVATLSAAGTQPEGQIIFNEQDGKLYKVVNGTPTPLIPLVGAQNGQLSDAQIAAISAAKVTGQLTSAQILSLQATQIIGQLVSSQIASVSASIVSGQLTSSQIASLDAAKLAGLITSTQITNGAIGTPQLAAGAVVASTIAAGAITANALAIGSSTNLIWNGTLDDQGGAASGWISEASYGGLVTVVAEPTGSNYRLIGYGTGRMTAYNFPAGNVATADWSPTFGVIGVPVLGGTRYGFSALIASGGPVAGISIVWYDGNNNYLSESDTAQSGGGLINNIGTSEANWVRAFGAANAPATACFGRFRILMTNTGSSTLASGFCLFTKCMLGPVGNNVNDPGPWVAGGVTTISGAVIQTGSLNALKIQANTITANQIMAGTITAGQIAANSILAANIAVGSNVNTIWNPNFYDSLAGWDCFFDYTGGKTAQLNTGYFAGGPGRTYASSSEWLSSDGSAFLQWTGPSSQPVSNTQSIILYWVDDGLGYPIASNVTVAASVYIVAGNNCVVKIGLQFVGISGNTVAYIESDAAGATPSNAVGSVTNTPGAPTGNSLDYYKRVGIIANAPACSYVIMQIRGYGTAAGAVQPYFSATHAQLGVVQPGTTQLPDWTAGGVTSISGAMIKTGTLNASKIIAGSITAGQIAAGTITATQLAAGSVTANQIAANAITAGAIAANAVTAGTVAAGAIAASQIAANQIYGYHLAAAQIISLQAQIGNLVVNTIHIIDNAITTYASASFSNKLSGNNAFQDGGSLNFNAQGAQSGVATISWELGFNGTTSTVGFSITINGTTTKSRTGEAYLNDYPSFTFPINCQNGSNTVQFQWWGSDANVACTLRTITVLTRLK